jgi:flagellar hook protein FlgE
MGLLDSISVGVSGLQSQSFALQNISGNIANSQTTAYKTTDTSFQDFLYAQTAGTTSPDGANALSSSNNLTQGSIQNSSISTNMAISGDGYFSVEAPSSTDASGNPSFSGTTTEYTRRGDFQLDSNGYLVNGAGQYLMGSSVDASGNPSGSQQLIQINSSTLPTGDGTLQGVTVASNGNIEGSFSGGQTVALGNVSLSTFRGEGFLQQNPDSSFSPTAESGTAIAGASGTIVGGALESSNTDITDQFSTMIQTQQAYSANTKVITVSDQMLQTLTSMQI